MIKSSLLPSLHPEFEPRGGGEGEANKTQKPLFIQNLLLYFAQDYKPPDIITQEAQIGGKGTKLLNVTSFSLGVKGSSLWDV